MEGFMVDTTNVNNCANDIQGYGDRIKDLQDSVRSIRTGMRHKLSAKGQIERTLRGIEDRMLDEAALMSSLDQALAHIAESYRRTERGLVTEGIRRSAGGQAVTEQQQAMMDQYMQAAIFGIMQEDQFSQEAWENASVEERKEILNRFLDRMEQEMGISLEDIQFRSGEDLGYNGAYNYADNYIALNEEILNVGDPSGAMTTLMHEARHAYQHAACENPDQFLVTADTIQGWQDSSDHYQVYLRDGKYSDIFSEIDAHDFAGQELKGGYVPLAGGIGDGAEMYSIQAEISDPDYVFEDRFGLGRPVFNMSYVECLKNEYDMVKVGESAAGYDIYEGTVIEEDGKLKSGVNWESVEHGGDYLGSGDLDGAKKVRFYIGNRPGTNGCVKMDTGSVFGVWGAENVYPVDSGKTIGGGAIIRETVSEENTAFLGDGKTKNSDILWELARDLDNGIVSSSLGEAKKYGPVNYCICKGFLGAYDPIGSICDIGQGYLNKDAGMYMKGAINMTMTSTDSEAANMIYGAADPMSLVQLQKK